MFDAEATGEQFGERLLAALERIAEAMEERNEHTRSAQEAARAAREQNERKGPSFFGAPS